MKLIVASKADQASMNIREALLKNYDFRKNGDFYRLKDLLLKTIDDAHIYHDNIDKEVEKEVDEKIERVVFISKHSSERAIDCLTCHPIGNFSRAEIGGKSFEVVPTDAGLMTEVVRNMLSSRFRVSFECTHHGPYLESKTFFAEIGSDEKSWNDKEKGETVANALMQAIKKDVKKDITAIAIGGGHYMPSPTEVIKKKEVAFGHMIPNYFLNSYKECIDMIMKKEDVKYAYLDKKAIKKQGFVLSEIRKELSDREIEEIESKSLPSI